MKVIADMDLDRFSKAHWILLGSFAVSSFLQALVITIEDPTYQAIFNVNHTHNENTSRHLAEKNAEIMETLDAKTGSVPLIDTEAVFKDSKDFSATFFGFLLLYFHLLSFILIPLIGGIIEDLGLKEVYMFGIYVAGLTPFLSAVLEIVKNNQSFLIYSFIIRGIQAVGAVGMQVALYMMITIIFPVHLASVFAVNQAMSILGILFGGPLAFFIGTLGGFAYRERTFWIIGGIYVGFALVLKAILPDLPPRESVPTTILNLIKSYFRFLTIPPILFYAFSLVVTGVGAAFLKAVMSLYIKNFDVGVLSGSMIPLLPALLQLLSPLWGLMLDRVKMAGIIALTGSVIVTLSLIFVGPLPLIPIEQSLILTCCALVIFGLGQGALIVSSYVLMMQESMERHFQFNSVTMTIMSMTYVGAMSAGEALGSMSAPVIYASSGFRQSTVLPLALYSILIPLFLLDGYFNPGKATTVAQLDKDIETDEMSQLVSSTPNSSLTP